MEGTKSTVETAMLRLGCGEPERDGLAVYWRLRGHLITLAGEEWQDHSTLQHGTGAEEIVMHLCTCSQSEAKRLLCLRQAAASSPRRQPPGLLEGLLAGRTFESAWQCFGHPHPDAVAEAVAFLTGAMLLPAAMVSQWMEEGVFHACHPAGHVRNAGALLVFPHRDCSGVVKGATLTAFKSSLAADRVIGDTGLAQFSVGVPLSEAKTVCLVSSPMDVLSYMVQRSAAHIVSVPGSSVSDALLQRLAGSSADVCIGFTDTQDGEYGWVNLAIRVHRDYPALVGRISRVIPAEAGLVMGRCDTWNGLLIARTILEQRSLIVEGNSAPLPGT